MTNAITLMGKALANEGDPEIQSLLSAAFARFGQEACSNKKYKSIAALCASFEKITAQRPGLEWIFARASESKIACRR